MAVQAAVELQSGANSFPDLSEEAFDYGEDAIGARVIGSRSVARMHHPRTHEHRHVDTDEFVVKKTSGSAGGTRGRLGDWCGSTKEKAASWPAV